MATLCACSCLRWRSECSFCDTQVGVRKFSANGRHSCKHGAHLSLLELAQLVEHATILDEAAHSRHVTQGFNRWLPALGEAQLRGLRAAHR